MTLCSCSGFNLNGYLVGDWEQNAIDYRAKAAVLYDEGKFEEAESYATKAFELSPNNEEGGILLAQIHMAQAGVDTISLIRSLTSSNSDSNLLSTSAASQLSSLSGIVGLTDAELNQLTIDGNEVDGVKGAPDSGIFVDLPVLLPKTAAEARSSGGNTIYHLNQAILALCKFVDNSMKVAADIRHGADSCESASTSTQNTEATFSWAFAHLSEAILFNNMINYPSSAETSNLQKRAALLDDSSVVSDTTAYISGIQELAAVIDVIMPISDSDSSMLIGMSNDLEAASLAFASLSGLPDSLKDGVVSSLSDLQTQQDSLESSGAENGDASALKNQLNSGLAQVLQTQITEKINSGSVSESEKSSLCSSYESISTSSLDVCS